MQISNKIRSDWPLLNTKWLNSDEKTAKKGMKFSKLKKNWPKESGNSEKEKSGKKFN